MYTCKLYNHNVYWKNLQNAFTATKTPQIPKKYCILVFFDIHLVFLIYTKVTDADSNLHTIN